MGLSAGVTSILTNSIESIRKEVKAGDNPCGDLDALKAQIDSYTPRKISTAQHDQLFAAIDHIKTENPC